MTSRDGRLTELFPSGQALLDAVEPGITVFNSEFELVSWNRAYERMGISSPERLRPGLTLLDNYRDIASNGIFGPGDPEALAQERWHAAASRSSPALEDLHTPEGRCIEIRRHFLADIGVAAVFTDVTRTRRAEQRVREAESMAQLGRVAGGLAHDFNNLLTVIICNLEIDREQGIATGEGVDTALEAARLGASLCRTTLAFSAGAAAPAASESIAIAECLRETVRFVNRVLPGCVRVGLNAGDSTSRIRADRARFCNVIINLVLNARDALPSGGLIRVSAAEVDDRVVIRVEDDGIGMDPQTLATAREPFVSTKGDSGGSGLGLSQVHEFNRATGGELQIESQAGIGTRVELRIPVARFSRDEPTTESLAPMTGSILVVEDDDAVRSALVRVARSLGLGCDEAGGFDQAETMLASREYDAVITDLWLDGGRRGVDLASIVRARFPSTSTVICSGDTTISDAVSGSLVLEKPISRSRFSRVLREALSKAPAAAPPA